MGVPDGDHTRDQAEDQVAHQAHQHWWVKCRAELESHAHHQRHEHQRADNPPNEPVDETLQRALAQSVAQRAKGCAKDRPDDDAVQHVLHEADQ